MGSLTEKINMKGFALQGIFVACLFNKVLGDSHCCEHKTVGEYNYTHVGSTGYSQCQDDCSYKRDDQVDGSLWCFKPGDLPVQCQDKGNHVHQDWSFGCCSENNTVINIKKGGEVVFVYEEGHNVTPVNETVWLTCEDINNPDPVPGPVEKTFPDVGIFYFVCGVGNGAHCNSPMKAKVIVTE